MRKRHSCTPANLAEKSILYVNAKRSILQRETIAIIVFHAGKLFGLNWKENGRSRKTLLCVVR